MRHEKKTFTVILLRIFLYTTLYINLNKISLSDIRQWLAFDSYIRLLIVLTIKHSRHVLDTVKSLFRCFLNHRLCFVSKRFFLRHPQWKSLMMINHLRLQVSEIESEGINNIFFCRKITDMFWLFSANHYNNCYIAK